MLLIPLVVLLPFGFYARWREDHMRRMLSDLWLPATFALVASLLAWWFIPKAGYLGIAAVVGSLWIMTATIRYYRRRIQALSGRWPSRSETGMCLAHFGVGLFLVGAGLTNALSTEKQLRMEAGDRFEVAGYEFVFEGTRSFQGPNYEADEGEFSVFRDGKRVTAMFPQKRRYINGQVMTEAAINAGITRDLYVSLGEPLDKNGTAWAVRLYHKPFIRFIWFGALLMLTGGFLAAWDRRYRRALPAPATKPAYVGGMAGEQPA